MMVAPDVADVDSDTNTTEIKRLYYHAQLNGSVTHVTDDDENVVESYEYTAYGQTTIKDISSTTISASLVGNPFMYTGRRLDGESGLYYYRARHYSPELKRFVQCDPLGYVGGPNALAYAVCSPIARIDPTGLKDAPPPPMEGKLSTFPVSGATPAEQMRNWDRAWEEAGGGYGVSSDGQYNLIGSPNAPSGQSMIDPGSITISYGAPEGTPYRIKRRHSMRPSEWQRNCDEYEQRWACYKYIAVYASGGAMEGYVANISTPTAGQRSQLAAWRETLVAHERMHFDDFNTAKRQLDERDGASDGSFQFLSLFGYGEGRTAAEAEAKALAAVNAVKAATPVADLQVMAVSAIMTRDSENQTGRDGQHSPKYKYHSWPGTTMAELGPRTQDAYRPLK